ncbi:hypothetical protein F4809DRAFT_249657 [Biscogniauxia mediterranea]|nr:hypothetical protein F4809DRAFT_249657 [Biscogniauxia mediterranea]
MAINVKHINSDACFLLTFEPVIPESVGEAVSPEPFTILLDPWITGPSKIFHSKISISTHKHPACISSLAELPSAPDIVIISQHKSDHCNEATLRQLPPSGTKTLILAEPASARLIKSWKYFDKEKIQTIERWEDPRLTGKQSVVRVPVPPVVPGGQEGEVTVAFIPQKRDLAGLHSAIGITYRPPLTHHLDNPASLLKILTPPATPESQTQISAYAGIKASPTTDSFLAPPSPPISPNSLRSVRSASTLMASPTRPSTRPNSTTNLRPVTASSNNDPLLARHSSGRPISVIFSPHGISYNYLESYITSHLVTEAALPLTALLHCMDRVENPWWLGGNVCAGVPTGAEIATKLGAKIWVSAHDGEKDVKGLATGMLKTRRWGRDEVEGALDSSTQHSKRKNHKGHDADNCSDKIRQAKSAGTEVMRLGSGDEVLVSGHGIWCSLGQEDNKWIPSSTAPGDTGSKPAQTATLNEKKQEGRVASSNNKKYANRPMRDDELAKMPRGKAPKSIGIYKALRTKDLLKPSPRLELEPLAIPTRGPAAEPPPPRLPRVESKKSLPRLGMPRSLKKSSSENQLGRFEVAAT